MRFTPFNNYYDHFRLNVIRLQSKILGWVTTSWTYSTKTVVQAWPMNTAESSNLEKF